MSNLITIDGQYTQEIEKQDITEELARFKAADYQFLTLMMSNRVKKRRVVQPRNFEYQAFSDLKRDFTVASYDAVTLKATITGTAAAKSIIKGDDLMVIVNGSGGTAPLGVERKIKSVEITGGNTVIEFYATFGANLVAGDVLYKSSHGASEGSSTRALLSADFVTGTQDMTFFRVTTGQTKIAKVAATWQDWFEENKEVISRALKSDMQGKMIFGQRQTSLEETDSKTGDITRIYDSLGLISGLVNNLWPAPLTDAPSYVSSTGQYDNFNGTITFPLLQKMFKKYCYGEDLFWFVDSLIYDQLVNIVYDKYVPVKNEKMLGSDIEKISIAGVEMKIVPFKELDKRRNILNGFVVDASDLTFNQYTTFEGFQAAAVKLSDNTWQEKAEVWSSGALTLQQAHKHGRTKL